MYIDNIETLRQAVANIRLEGLELSDEVKVLLFDAIVYRKLKTSDIINLLNEKK
jgi:hypothetical protein